VTVAARPKQPVAHYSGEDAFTIDRAVAALAVTLGDETAPLELWRVAADDASGDSAASTARAGAAEKRTDRLLDEIEQRVGTQPMFGGGTLVVVRQPGSLLRAARTRDRLLRLVAQVPPGNGLAFVDVTDGSARRGKAADVLRDAVAAQGGDVRAFPALSGDRMEGWLATRARDLGVRLAPGAARLLAERIGAFVREGDVDRRRQTEVANSELDKLALLRPDGTVTREDVAELVPEVIPGSMWAFLDAVAARRSRPAADLAQRLLTEGSPMPVVVSQLHRRVRELIVVREHLSTGTSPAQLVRVLKIQPFRAQKLSEQAAAWTIAELEHALEGILELDLASKGMAVDGTTASMSDERSALLLSVWLSEHLVGAR
jgi:DNA polymerase III delta subunit